MYKKLTFILLTVIIMVFLTGCVPFVKGVEIKDCFTDNAQYSTFVVDAGVQGGFVESAKKNISMEKLTDSNEKNIQYKSYKSITFNIKDQVIIDYITFVLQSDNDVTMIFRLESGEQIQKKTIAVKKNKKEIIEFSGLGFDFKKRNTISLFLMNPVTVNETKYMFDSFIFIAAE